MRLAEFWKPVVARKRRVVGGRGRGGAAGGVAFAERRAGGGGAVCGGRGRRRGEGAERILDAAGAAAEGAAGVYRHAVLVFLSGALEPRRDGVAPGYVWCRMAAVPRATATETLYVQ